MWPQTTVPWISWNFKLVVPKFYDSWISWDLCATILDLEIWIQDIGTKRLWGCWDPHNVFWGNTFHHLTVTPKVSTSFLINEATKFRLNRPPVGICLKLHQTLPWLLFIKLIWFFSLARSRQGLANLKLRGWEGEEQPHQENLKFHSLRPVRECGFGEARGPGSLWGRIDFTSGLLIKGEMQEGRS